MHWRSHVLSAAFCEEGSGLLLSGAARLRASGSLSANGHQIVYLAGLL